MVVTPQGVRKRPTLPEGLPALVYIFSATHPLMEVKPMGFWTYRAAPLSMALAVALAGCNQPAPAPAPAPAAPAAPALSPVERGKMLVIGGGCHDCHTPKKLGPNGPEADMSRM